MLGPDYTPLVHAVGFVTGIALYAMLAAMVLRAGGGDARATGLAPLGDRIPLATAVLGLVWNVGGLAVYGVPGLMDSPRASWAREGAAALAFSALGFLPAVVVHAALQGERGRVSAALPRVAYALSLAAAAMHAAGAVRGGAPTREALQLLSVGFAIVLGALVVRLRGHVGARGPLAAAALAAFAVMAVHLGHHGDAREPVLAELLGHHASLALALVILYQDYRFALADLFLKRALSAVALVGFALAAYLAAAPFVAPRLAADPTDPRAVAMLLGLWIGTAVLYPVARRRGRGLRRPVVLRRVDYGELPRRPHGALAGLTRGRGARRPGRAARPRPLGRRVRGRRFDRRRYGAPAWGDARHQLVAGDPLSTRRGDRLRANGGGPARGRRPLLRPALLEERCVIAPRGASTRCASTRSSGGDREARSARSAGSHRGGAAGAAGAAQPALPVQRAHDRRPPRAGGARPRARHAPAAHGAAARGPAPAASELVTSAERSRS
jgi:hypothetical protein